MCALRRPVAAHCRMNCGWERFAICAVTSTDSGTVTSATTASSGEIQNITPSTPTTVSTDVTSCDSVWVSVWEMLSMSFVTRERISPRALRSKYDSGRRASLACTSPRSR